MTDYSRELKSLIIHSTVANFEYWSEFIIRLQRNIDASNDAPPGNGRIPPIFCLRLRNVWWVGNRDEWHNRINSFPIKSPPHIPEETPLQASVIVEMLESTVVDVYISQMGDLNISLSNGKQLHVQGANGMWEESWFLELPIDDPDRDKWSFICTSDGAIHIRSPLKSIEL